MADSNSLFSPNEIIPRKLTIMNFEEIVLFCYEIVCCVYSFSDEYPERTIFA